MGEAESFLFCLGGTLNELEICEFKEGLFLGRGVSRVVFKKGAALKAAYTFVNENRRNFLKTIS